MQARPTAWFPLLFFLVSCASQRPAQQSEAVRKLADLRAKAEKGNADAQCRLGDCYHFGEGVAKDEVEAVKWWRKAAEQNVPHAQANLGDRYYFGEGVAKDDVEAVKWWRKATEQNLAHAQVNLGMCYAHGLGVAKDEVEAINLYRKAGEGGEAGGFNNLAWILATSEKSAIRNGSNAVSFGEKAVAATKRKNPTFLDTLAAAYAETSQFEKAVKTEQEAIALVQTKEEANAFRTRLRLYEAKEPYRDKD
jgi:TPR repeat protein